MVYWKRYGDGDLPGKDRTDTIDYFGNRSRLCHCGTVSYTHLSSYVSKDIRVTLTKHTTNRERNGRSYVVTYFVADIYIRNIENFRTAFAQGEYGHGYRDNTVTMAKDNNAVVALDVYKRQDPGRRHGRGNPPSGGGRLRRNQGCRSVYRGDAGRVWERKGKNPSGGFAL